MKHQLLSNEVLLPNEDLGAFADLENELRAVLAPEGMLEAELVERIIALTWRLERMGRLESALLIWQRFEVLGMNQVEGEEMAEREADLVDQTELEILEEDAADEEAEEEEADEDEAQSTARKAARGRQRLKELRRTSCREPMGLIMQAKAKAKRMAEEAGVTDVVLFASVFQNIEGSLGKLLRHENSIERSLHRTMHELERLQASRKGQAVPLPVAVDIDVTDLTE